jgi:hypothetical protein
MTRTQRIRELLAIGNDTHTIAEKLEREYGPTSRANMRALISYARRNPPGTRGRPRKARARTAAAAATSHR